MGLVGAAIDVCVIDLRFLFRKPTFLFPFAAVCSKCVCPVMLSAIVTTRYFVFVMEGVQVSMDWFLPVYFDDRTFARMELHQPPTSSKVEGLLRVFPSRFLQ